MGRTTFIHSQVFDAQRHRASVPANRRTRMTNADPNREAQLKPARETDEAYFARLKEAAHRIMDFHETDDDVKNPDYVEGFENGYIKAFHTLSETCDVFTFANEGANRF